VRALAPALPLLALLGVACSEGPPPEAGGPSTAVVAAFPESWPATFGLGREPGAEVAAWDRDARPDGAGLPPGRGSVAEGEVVYRQRCAACHGPTGTEGPNDRLVGREPGDDFPFGRSPDARSRQTIGSYWPWATTVFDYINRAMPQNAPGSLTTNEVYAVTAYLLHLNRIVPADAVMGSAALAVVVMPARDRFVPDDRTGGPVIR